MMRTTTHEAQRVGQNRSSRTADAVALCMMGALAMSFGWGFRGDYGHEAGAMVPGALLAMGVCLVSGRPDWSGRCAVMGLCGALGWAFGGQMSYGQIPSYTVSHSFPDVAYGYACLFTVGALWGGIGGAILSMALTKARAEINRFIGPMVAVFASWYLAYLVIGLAPGLQERFETFTEFVLHDTDWLPALLALLVAGAYWLAAPKARPACDVILVMAAGWGVGYLVLVRLFGLHMSPTPAGSVRSDNWAGCAGMFAALLAYHWTQRNRAGLMLAMYGALAGGIGFAVGDFLNKPDKVRWAPLYGHEWLRGFDHWKWTEQSFGLIMGLGVAFGLLRLLRGNLADPDEPAVPQASRLQNDAAATRLNDFAVFFLLIPMLWLNLFKNVRKWAEPAVHAIPNEKLLGLPAPLWFLLIGVCLSLLVLYALVRHRRGALPLAPATALGKGQMLFLAILWVAAVGALLQAFPGLKSKGILFVHASFWLTAIVCTGLALRPTGAALTWHPGAAFPPEDDRWRLGWRHGLLWALMPLLIFALTALTLSMHDQPMPGSNLRFGPNAYHVSAGPGSAGILAGM